MFQLSWGKLRREPATRWFDRSFAPIPTSDERFARQYRYELPPEFPLASPCAGIAHHLSGRIDCALARTSHKGRSRAMLTPQHTRMGITVKMNPHLHFHFAFEISILEHLHKRYTPWSVFQDGSMGFVYTQRHRPFLQNPGAIGDHAEAITHLPSPSTCEDSNQCPYVLMKRYPQHMHA